MGPAASSAGGYSTPYAVNGAPGSIDGSVPAAVGSTAAITSPINAGTPDGSTAPGSWSRATVPIGYGADSPYAAERAAEASIFSASTAAAAMPAPAPVPAPVF